MKPLEWSAPRARINSRRFSPNSFAGVELPLRCACELEPKESDHDARIGYKANAVWKKEEGTASFAWQHVGSQVVAGLPKFLFCLFKRL